MQTARIENHTKVIGIQQGYRGLYVRETPVVDPISKNKTVLQETAWTPTPAELVLLNLGCSVHVKVMSANHPPMMVGVGPLPDEANPVPEVTL